MEMAINVGARKNSTGNDMAVNWEIEAKRFIENVLSSVLAQPGSTMKIENHDGKLSTSGVMTDIGDYAAPAVAKAFMLAKNYGICSEVRMGAGKGCSYSFWKASK